MKLLHRFIPVLLQINDHMSRKPVQKKNEIYVDHLSLLHEYSGTEIRKSPMLSNISIS